MARRERTLTWMVRISACQVDKGRSEVPRGAIPAQEYHRPLLVYSDGLRGCCVYVCSSRHILHYWGIDLLPVRRQDPISIIDMLRAVTASIHGAGEGWAIAYPLQNVKPFPCVSCLFFLKQASSRNYFNESLTHIPCLRHQEHDDSKALRLKISLSLIFELHVSLSTLTGRTWHLKIFHWSSEYCEFYMPSLNRSSYFRASASVVSSDIPTHIWDTAGEKKVNLGTTCSNHSFKPVSGIKPQPWD